MYIKQRITNLRVHEVIWAVKIIWNENRCQVANYQQHSANSRTVTNVIIIKHDLMILKHNSSHWITTFKYNNCLLFNSIRPGSLLHKSMKKPVTGERVTIRRPVASSEYSNPSKRSTNHALPCRQLEIPLTMLIQSYWREKAMYQNRNQMLTHTTSMTASNRSNTQTNNETNDQLKEHFKERSHLSTTERMNE